MALNVQGAFDHLRAHLSDHYIIDGDGKGTLTIKDKYYPEGQGKAAVRKITFGYTGDAFAFNLDWKTQKNKREFSPPLFQFLDDQAKPWSKKCDYIIFHRLPRNIFVYYIELKSNSIKAENIAAQLEAGHCWVQSLKNILDQYTGIKRPLKVQKFVFSSNNNPAAYLGPELKYLVREPSIRFYNYSDLIGMNLEDLENSSVVTV